MIVDSHAHIFPFLGAPAGYPSAADHLRWLQLYMVSHKQPVRRVRDHVVVADTGLADLPVTDPEQLRDVGFRIEENGRFVWRHEGEDLYIHFMPPSLQTNVCAPEYLLAEMAYCGVEVAVLQNAHLYGRLNEYFAAACARHPGKLVGLAEVDEARAGDADQVASLRSAVKDLGMRGLYYANRGLLFPSYRHGLDDECFEPLWEAVRELGIPVFWEILGLPDTTDADLMDQLRRLGRWADRHPDISCIYTHGFAPGLLADPMPDPVRDIMRREQFLIEILYPISWGRDHEYPYPELDAPIRAMLRQAGSERLAWGSDMPNVLRHCTYRQSLEYLRRHLSTLGCSAAAQDAVLGGNTARRLNVRVPRP